MNDFQMRLLPLSPVVQPLARRVRLNSIWLLLARLITQAALVMSTVLIARTLGVVGFGQYAFVAAVIFLGNVATTFGTDTLLIREVARDRQASASLVGAALWLQLALSASWLIVAFIVGQSMIDQSAEVLLAVQIYSLSLIPLAFFTVYTAVLRAHERMDLYLLLSAGVAVMQLGGVWWVLQENRSLSAFVMMLNGVQLAAAIFAGAVCRRYLRAFHFQWTIEQRQLLHLVRLAWPFALLGALAVIYQRLGVLMLSALGTEADTGWYAAASRVIEPVKLLHFAVLGALLPALARLIPLAADPQQAQLAVRVFQRSVLFLLAISVLLVLLVMAFAEPLVTVLFGATYTPSVALVKVLAVSLIPYTISAAWSVRLVAQGRERRVTWALALSLAVAFILNRWLIPAQGSSGAALAVVISESVFAAAVLMERR
jgi:O-antigen/teichoic acid export membrane protein